MGKPFFIDESEFPLVRLHYYDLLTDEEFEEQLAGIDRLLLARRPHALVVDTHHQRMMPLSQVRRQASHMKQRADLSRQYVCGIALVIPSAVIRGVLKVVLSIAPMPVAYAVFDDARSAETWARGQLATELSAS